MSIIPHKGYGQFSLICAILKYAFMLIFYYPLLIIQSDEIKNVLGVI